MATGIIARANQSVTNQNVCGVVEIPREDTNCDSTSQSCFENASANPFYSSTGAKVVGGVLGAAALAGSLGFGILETDDPDGSPLSVDRLIRRGNKMERLDRLIEAAGAYESAAELLALKQDYAMALELLDDSRRLRTRLIERIEAGAKTAKADGSPDSDGTQDRMTVLLINNSIAGSLELYGEILANTVRKDEAKLVLSSALETYYGAIRGLENLQDEFPDISMPTGRLEFMGNASRVAARLARHFEEKRQYAEAARFAEDAVMLATFAKVSFGGDLIPAGDPHEFDRLRLHYALAQLAEYEGNVHHAKHEESRREEKMRLGLMLDIYRETRVFEGMAWALGRLSSFAVSYGTEVEDDYYDYKAGFGATTTSGSLYYLLATDRDRLDMDERVDENSADLKPFKDAFQRLSADGRIEFPAELLLALTTRFEDPSTSFPPVDSIYTRNYLTWASNELRDALQVFENFVEEDDAESNLQRTRDIAQVRAGFLLLMSSCEGALGNFENAAIIFEELEDAWRESAEPGNAAAARYERISALTAAVEMAESQRRPGREVLNLRFRLMSAFRGSEEVFAGADGVDESFTRKLEEWRSFSRERAQDLAVSFGIVSPEELDKERALARSQLRSVAMRAVQSLSPLAIREFASVAGEVLGKTPDDVMSALTEGGNTNMALQIRFAIGDSEALFDLLRRTVRDLTRPPTGKASEKKEAEKVRAER